MEIELKQAVLAPDLPGARCLVFLVPVRAACWVALQARSWPGVLRHKPGPQRLIAAVLAIGTILAFRQVIRLYPEIAWVNNFRIADPGLAVARHPPCWRRWRRSSAANAPDDDDLAADHAASAGFDRHPAR
jgi:hypothetical protein